MMERSKEMSGNGKNVESVSVVEFNADTDRFRKTYDSTRDSTSVAVIEVVATALGKNPLDLTPLHSAVDTDALDKLTTGSVNGLMDDVTISFRYEKCDVIVSAGGVIEVAPPENT